MPRDGNGNYSLPTGNPVISGTTILSTWANATMPDLGQEITNSLARGGQGGMLAPLQLLDGTLGLPGMSFTNEPTTGFYRSGIGEVSYASGSALRATFKLNGNISVAATAPSVAADLTRKDYVDASGSNLQGQIDNINAEQGVQNGRLDGIDSGQTVQDGRLTALEIAPGWNAYLDGYLSTGLHAEYTGDLDNILINSSYNFLGTNCTNFPADFDGTNWGFITTHMFAQGTSNATQILVGMNGNNDYKQWVRQREVSAWEPWKLVVDGGAFTQRLAGYQDTGLHGQFSGDLDAIVVNSKYFIDAATVTNDPAEFVGLGTVETNLWNVDTDQAVQLLVTMDDAGAGAAFIRHKEAGVWSIWAPYGSGGGTEITDTPPANPREGDTWWDNNLGKSFVYYVDADSAQWVEEIPVAPGVAIRAGMIGAFPHGNPGANWLFCDGAAVSRTAFPLLFQMIGTTYGAGDGSTTFNLPDYRGQFMRGQDAGAGVDPNAGARTDRGDGTGGDNVGTKQVDDLKSHQHASVMVYPGSYGGAINLGHYAQGVTSFTGGNETRPVNTYVRYYIFIGGQMVESPVVVAQSKLDRPVSGALTGTISSLSSPPLITEGQPWHTMTITPTQIGSKIEVDAVLTPQLNAGIGAWITLALFVDGASEAVATAAAYNSVISNVATNNLKLAHEFYTTSLNPVTLQFRAGTHLGDQLTVAGLNGGLSQYARAREFIEQNTVAPIVREGAWTMDIFDNALIQKGQTYAVNNCYYHRIGNMVKTWGEIKMSSLGTLTTLNPARLHGWPFTVSSKLAATNIVINYFDSFGTFIDKPVLGGYISGGAATPEGIIAVAGLLPSSVSTVTLAELSASGRFFFTCDYLTDDA